MAGGQDFTANLSLPFLISNQAQKHVTLNESLRALDGLVQASILSRADADPPVYPSEGDRYLVAASATGDWAGQEGNLALYADGGWLFYAPQTGWRIWVEDEALFLVHDGTNWRDTVPDELQNLTRLGLNATADASNPFLAQLNALLFNALYAGAGGTGDLRAKLNKEASGNVLSVLFQSDYSTRAELGLVGDDDFLLKVSPDGSTFHEGIRIDRLTGKPSFPNGVSLSVLALSDTPSGFSGAAGKALVVNADGDAIEFVARREVLTADRTYYVDASLGANANDGLSSGAPFATIKFAVDTALALDVGAYNVTIQCADGTYTEQVLVSGVFVGSGSITIRGNPTTPSNVHIDSPAHGLSIQYGASIRIEGVKLTASSGNGILVVNGGKVEVSGPVDFGENNRAHMRVEDPGSLIKMNADYAISAAGPRHIECIRGGRFLCNGRTVSIAGTPNFSTAFVDCNEVGSLQFTGAIFSGPATGKRYKIDSKGYVSTGGGGASYFPGSLAGTGGTTSDSGLYL